MRAQPTMSEDDVTRIARYVREVQQVNGIVYQERQM